MTKQEEASENIGIGVLRFQSSKTGGICKLSGKHVEVSTSVVDWVAAQQGMVRSKDCGIRDRDIPMAGWERGGWGTHVVERADNMFCSLGG